MNKVSTAALREYAAAGAITAVKAIHVQEGYSLVINVNWKEGDLTVYTQQNKPRAWQSIDRLIGHLQRAAPGLKHFEIHLNGNQTL